MQFSEGSPLIKQTSDSKTPSDSSSEVLEEEGSRLLKTIGKIGSFCLVCNNTTGPAMMGLPQIFQDAGLFPSIFMIIIVCIFSSLCGTMLSDAIASVPGNHDFTHNIDFSGAFHIIGGDNWYTTAETLFLISCYAQACAAIAETAQSLDSFLASFLLGKTYALQIAPQLEFLSWSPELCNLHSADQNMGSIVDMQASALEDCTPFHHAGGLVLSLGFLLTTILFLPLGRHELKETIGVQIASFAILFILLVQFFFEFHAQELHSRNSGHYHEVPMFGTKYSQLSGVVLFNYAFCITVPAWLGEKKSDVSVNQVVWGSSLLSSALFIAFGAVGAAAFKNVTPNMLTLLASSKVHYLTRLSAAVFGVVIIGCGVPVFCVIIKRALANNKVCSPGSALFWGSIFPYCISWMLYKGQLVLQLLNWTGLVVNGLVAFILPMILSLKSFAWKETLAKEAAVYKEEHELSRSKSNDSTKNSKGTIELTTRVVEGSSPSQAVGNLYGSNRITNLKSESDEQLPHPQHFHFSHYRESTVYPLPAWLEPYKVHLAVAIIVTFTATIALNLVLDLIDGTSPS